MVKKIVLKAGERSKEKAAVLRRSGIIPGVLYSGGQKPLNIQLKAIEVEKLLEEGQESALIDLEVGGKAVKSIIRDVQYDPVKGNAWHVDFYEVDMKKEVEVSIPLKFVNEAPGSKDQGGILNYNKESLDVSCLPGDIIESIEVDLSSLANINSAIYVSDLPVPSSLKPLSEASELVVNVVAPKKAAEPAPEEAEAAGEEGEAKEEGQAEGKEEKPDESNK